MFFIDFSRLRTVYFKFYIFFDRLSMPRWVILGNILNPALFKKVWIFFTV
jgi:hypothetical protein